MTKIIDIIRKHMPETPGYADSVAVLLDGVTLYEGEISSEPNPYQPSTMQSWVRVYARVAEGAYVWQLIPNHSKYGRCLLLNGGAVVKTENPNQNHNGRYEASEIFIYRGDTDNWRGSRGCLTVPPKAAEKFFSVFDDLETGKLTIRKATA